METAQHTGTTLHRRLWLDTPAARVRVLPRHPDSETPGCLCMLMVSAVNY